jgi:hypothetical protein
VPSEGGIYSAGVVFFNHGGMNSALRGVCETERVSGFVAQARGCRLQTGREDQQGIFLPAHFEKLQMFVIFT